MKDRIYNTPEGVRDIYGAECERKLQVEAAISEAIRLFGYEHIETPTFEFFDVFSEERGTARARDMYKFFDREGNTLVLRPDITPSVARCVAKYFKNDEMPIRICYKGNTFINSSEYQGKAKESTQIGAELINDGSVSADAEMVAMTVECLMKAGLKEFQVELGDVRFFRAITEEAGFDPDDIEELRRLIEDKNTLGIEDFLRRFDIPDELKKVFIALPQLFGPFEKLGEFKKLTANKEALAAIASLEEIYGLLRLYGFDRYVSFDLGMLSKYGYYTGIIFNAYTYGTGDALISGGRYDRLVGQFGKEAPAIGLAVITDRIMTALARQGIATETGRDKLLLIARPEAYNAALQAAIVARQCGRCAQVLVLDRIPEESELEGLRTRFCATESVTVR